MSTFSIKPGSIRANHPQYGSRGLADAMDRIARIILNEENSAADCYQSIGEELQSIGYVDNDDDLMTAPEVSGMFVRALIDDERVTNDEDHHDVGQHWDDTAGVYVTVCVCGALFEGISPDDADGAHANHRAEKTGEAIDAELDADPAERSDWGVTDA